MQSKVLPSKPFLMLLYGYPGAGKSTFARQFTGEMPIVHLDETKIKYELHESTKGQAVGGAEEIIDFMVKEFLAAGVSVILDKNVSKVRDRKKYMHLAKKANSSPVLLIWIQLDPESAFMRTQKRDRRKSEEKYALEYSKSDFQQLINESQNPDNEDYVVISGKHTFQTQRGSVMKKLFEKGILSRQDAHSKVVKPGLVNLIPQPMEGRDDFPRRHISIR